MRQTQHSVFGSRLDAETKATMHIIFEGRAYGLPSSLREQSASIARTLANGNFIPLVTGRIPSRKEREELQSCMRVWSRSLLERTRHRKRSHR